MIHFSLKPYFAYLITLLFIAQPTFAIEKVLVYAAASTSSTISEIIDLFNEQNADIQVKVSFASSSTLAKQIEAGAPAHIYISASTQWMDYLQQRQLINIKSRLNILSNKLVLITPKGKFFELDMNLKKSLPKKLDGKLCLGDPAHVPVGIYAKQALTSLGWWDMIKPNIVGTKDVRAALTLVERGECTAGIVYSTDANASTKIDLIAEFPSTSHNPIHYPVATLPSAPNSAHTFLNYLRTPQAKTIFNQYGFTTTQ
ncbi:MAG: molybdate ABC transporter substrate-binding protein [Methylococcales bacterium]|nr:molybdate ABC transporter substrate-binding protein [Methylococcales bacterium]